MINFTSNTVQVHIAAYFEEFMEYKYLLLKRSTKVKVYPGIWQVITGTIEGDETAVASALRETYEEIGGNPLRMWSLPYVTHFFSPADNTIHSSPVFGMLIDSNIPIKLSKEHEKYEWLHLELALAKLPLPSHREAAGIFYEYILSADNTHLFELNLNDYLN